MSDNVNEKNEQYNPYISKEEVGVRENASQNDEPQAADTVAPQNAQTAAPQSPVGQTATAQGASHTFNPNGQYSVVRPQGGTTYILPRPQPHSDGQSGAAQMNGAQTNGAAQMSGAAQSPYNGQSTYGAQGAYGAQQQTYQRPYTAYQTNGYGYQPHYAQQQTTPPPKKEKKRGGAAVAIVAILCVVSVLLSGVAGFAGSYLSNNLFGNGTVSPSGGVSDGDIAVIYRSVSTDDEAKNEASLNDVVIAVENSVVEITTEFKSMGYFQYVTSGAGSGVIISENGYIITNNHVITSDNKVADAITVRLKNGDEHKASVVGYDADSDIAVIKIEGEEFTAAVFADSDKLVVGQDIVAIGNPLGELGGTVTEGIISALDREVDVDGTTMNLLQISAAVNPGNSGGGLFNMKGELVGIVNAKSSGEGIEGLGFAIPSNDAVRISEELMTNGYVTGKPYVGISLYYAADAYTAYRYFKSQVPGLYVAEVVEGYNDQVLQTGDRVVAVNGNEISTSDDVKNYVNKCKIGDTMTFSIYRNGKQMEVEVTCYEYVPDRSQIKFD